ncbi:MAG TPA: hypothetical protein VF319_11670 [Caldimonas sp.]
MNQKKALTLDPMRAWRDWFIGSEMEWSEALTRLMKDEAVAKTMGQDFGAALHRQQMFAEVIGKSLAALNLPSREEVLALGERMGRVEDGLASVQASLTQLRLALGATVTPQAAADRLPRTRKAPAAPPTAALPANPARKAGR